MSAALCSCLFICISLWFKNKTYKIHSILANPQIIISKYQIGLLSFLHISVFDILLGHVLYFKVSLHERIENKALKQIHIVLKYVTSLLHHTLHICRHSYSDKHQEQAASDKTFVKPVVADKGLAFSFCQGH